MVFPPNHKDTKKKDSKKKKGKEVNKEDSIEGGSSDSDIDVDDVYKPEVFDDFCQEGRTLITQYFTEDQLKLFVGANFEKVISGYLFETEEERAMCFRIFWHKYFFAFDETFKKNQRPKELSLSTEENGVILKDVNPLNIMIKRFDHPSIAKRVLERCTGDLEDSSTVRVPWQSKDIPRASYFVENGKLKLNEDFVYLSSYRDVTNIVVEGTHPFHQYDMQMKYSLRFLEMMYISGGEYITDCVSRAVIDFQKGNVSGLQILLPDQEDPKSKFYNQENCAFYGILKVDLGRNYDDGTKQEAFVPLELYLDNQYHRYLHMTSEPYSDIVSMKDKIPKVSL